MRLRPRRRSRARPICRRTATSRLTRMGTRPIAPLPAVPHAHASTGMSKPCLERTNCSDDQPVIVDLNAGGQTVLSTSDLNFGFEPAVRAVAGYRLHNGWAIEGAYLGLFDADTSEYLSALPDQSSILTFPGDLAYVDNLNVIPDMDKIWVDYSSSLHSGELNLVCCCGCCDPCGKGGGKNCNLSCRTFEWLVGFRYINFREELNIHGQAIRQTGSRGWLLRHPHQQQPLRGPTRRPDSRLGDEVGLGGDRQGGLVRQRRPAGAVRPRLG